MKIYFVRHGQTNLNQKRLIQGRIDAPLNRVGIKQAKDTGQLLKTLNFEYNKIVSSPLSRALETAYWIGRKMNYRDNFLIKQNLIERDFGSYEFKTIKEHFGQIMVDGFDEPGFENSKTLINRIDQAVNELYIDFKNQTIIAVVHAHVIRSIYILSDPNKYTYTNFFLGNASIHEFDFDGKNYKLINTYNNEE